MVRAGGLEPPRAFAQQILSLACLPFHHARNQRCLQLLSLSRATNQQLRDNYIVCELEPRGPALRKGNSLRAALLNIFAWWLGDKAAFGQPWVQRDCGFQCLLRLIVSTKAK